MSERYKLSEELLRRALQSIPLGSQTFSKSLTQFPHGVSPYFIERGKGSHVWDVDGNEYVDFINGLLSVSLGYCDPDVDLAVQQQLQQGVIFSLPHCLEMEVAEKVIQMVPCAEKVRFGKNGSDATAGAIRVARAYTGRDRIVVCGYHGWQDWYIGSTSRNLGVPQVTRELTHTFSYNNLESLEEVLCQYPSDIAAVILEPMNVVWPEDGFLEQVKSLAHKHGALLIFDEMITGFRFAKGGAQELFGVTPDLATFGKGIANGFPLSVVVGNKDVMKVMDEIFFSFTFGGETLSLAAANAVLNKIQGKPVVETLHAQGKKLMNGVVLLIEQHKVGHIFSLAGHASWSFLVINNTGPYSQWEVKTLFLQEVFKRGILTIGTHNISYAHTDEDIGRLLEVYAEVFPMIRTVVERESLHSVLQAKPLQPLFNVR